LEGIYFFYPSDSEQCFAVIVFHPNSWSVNHTPAPSSPL
jgi:hypothetical protein